MPILNNDQWQEALVQLANSGVTVAPALDIQASGTIAGTTAVTVSFGTGAASWTVDISGTIGAGTVLQFEYLINSAWFPAFGVVVGSSSDVAVSSVTLASAGVSYQGNAAGFQQFRVRCSSYNGTDSLTIKIVGSVATDGGFVSKSLPPGTNLIGSVNAQRSTVAVFSQASGATSGSTQNSGDLAVGTYTELSIDINTTAQSGTNPTLQLFYERKGADNIYYVLWQSAVLTAAANTISTSIGAGMAYNQSLGLTGRLRWVVGGTATPTYTMSINCYAK